MCTLYTANQPVMSHRLGTQKIDPCWWASMSTRGWMAAEGDRGWMAAEGDGGHPRMAARSVSCHSVVSSVSRVVTLEITLIMWTSVWCEWLWMTCLWPAAVSSLQVAAGARVNTRGWSPPPWEHTNQSISDWPLGLLPPNTRYSGILECLQSCEMKCCGKFQK